MDIRGKFSQPSGIYSLRANHCQFLLVPSARFTICHLGYHGQAGFAKSRPANFLGWRGAKLMFDLQGAGKVFIICYQEVD